MYHRMHKLDPGQSVLFFPFGWIGSEIAHFCWNARQLLGTTVSCFTFLLTPFPLLHLFAAFKLLCLYVSDKT